MQRGEDPSKAGMSNVASTGSGRVLRTDGRARRPRGTNMRNSSGTGLSVNVSPGSAQALQRHSHDEANRYVHFKALKPTLLIPAHSASKGAQPYLISRGSK